MQLRSCAGLPPRSTGTGCLSDMIRLRVVLRVRTGLGYLAYLALDIPPRVLERLDIIRTCAMERDEFRMFSPDRKEVLKQPGGALRLVLVDYWRLHVGVSPASGLLGLPNYLLFRWRLKERPPK